MGRRSPTTLPHSLSFLPAAAPQVWATLTDYQNLAKVVPNLVSNTVLSAEAHVGARLQQVGAARLGGVATFTAQTTLDVREYRHGLPPNMEAETRRDQPRLSGSSRECRDSPRLAETR